MINKNVPSHVGIIMDGNGRWATARGKKRSFGHKAGSDNVDRIVTHAFNRGIKSLTLYAFSSENWSRPKEEVDELMRLLKVYFKKFSSKIMKNNVRLTVSGEREGLSSDLIKVIEDGEKKTEGLCLQCARELGVPVDDIMGDQLKKFGISPDQMDELEQNMAELAESADFADLADDDNPALPDDGAIKKSLLTMVLRKQKTQNRKKNPRIINPKEKFLTVIVRTLPIWQERDDLTILSVGRMNSLE